MGRRVSMPAADDLFRTTVDGTEQSVPAGKGRKNGAVRVVPDAPEATDTTEASGGSGSAKGKKPSGRIRHDEKITVYVTAAELMELEQTRLHLRGEHGLVVDRGRLVREAIGLVLADFEAQGEDSALVRRLRE
ncbi:hypothetical protein E8D34_20100 [Nocardioides sp. GY 10113]|uniref:hypothetical protein n=1 Tax=Nocardioides sp. GY 10113 TaxID=2569761 RepID=UPI0010A8E7F6|nr:hypothetical protein [Nocardioides sp. GY 10113]TIC79623.1 hypothetical protein E8D34_20305 [Nocardioides sp. GY 10113]TIC79630.1 hypothetical protein E8D34_20100 [Nocardioides sp. GY 10113]